MEGTTQRKTDEGGPKSPRSPRSPKGSSKAISKEELEKIEENKKKAINAIKKKTQKNSLSNYGYHIVIGGFVLVCVAALISTFFGGTKKLSLISVIENEEIAAHNQQDLGFTLGKNDFFDVKYNKFFSLFLGSLLPELFIFAFCVISTSYLSHTKAPLIVLKSTPSLISLVLTGIKAPNECNGNTIPSDNTPLSLIALTLRFLKEI